MSAAKDEKLFYGWYIVGMTFVCRFMATGVGFYIFNAFMIPLGIERGWSVPHINYAPMIGGVITWVGTYIYGTLVMRVGPRPLMAIGPIVSGIAFAALGQAQHLWQFYLLFVLLFFGNGAMAGIVANTAVNNWFSKKRGKALGLSMVGISLSGALLPVIAMFIIERTDLANAFLWIGAMILAAAPASWLVIRNRPEEHGMVPDGVVDRAGEGTRSPGVNDETFQNIPLADDPMDGGFEAVEVTSSGGIEKNVWTFSMVVRLPTFWKMGVVYSLAMMSVVAVMFQLAPRFINIGFDNRDAMYMMSMTALLGALGKYVWGMLCDYFDPRRVVAALITLTGFGLGLGLIQDSTLALVSFIVIFGFSMGGVVSTHPVMIAFLFGRESYASVARFLGLLIRLQLVGYFIMGQSVERTGSYDKAYISFIFFNLIAAAIVLTLKKQKFPDLAGSGNGGDE